LFSSRETNEAKRFRDINKEVKIIIIIVHSLIALIQKTSSELLTIHY